jgi:hypothetical protein
MRTQSYAVPDEVLTAHLEGEAVLLHMDTKNYFRLNATAAVLWKGLERGLDREALLDELLAQFEVDRPTAAAELDRLLGELAARGLLAPGA